MCGRYALAFDSNEIAAQFKAYNLEVRPELAKDEYHSRSYNVAPTNDGVVYRTKDKELRYMKWGLVPHWTENVSEFKTYRTFNARLENLQESRMWIQCCNRKRCAIPISGYYEWKTQGKAKYPYYIKRKDNKLMFLAGMYDYVEKEDLWTYTIVTAEAPHELSWLHARMPIVIVPGSDAWDAWMNPKKVEWSTNGLNSICAAHYDNNALTIYRVSEDVGKVQNNGEHLIKPIFREDRIKAEIRREDESNELPVEEEYERDQTFKDEKKGSSKVPENLEKEAKAAKLKEEASVKEEDNPSGENELYEEKADQPKHALRGASRGQKSSMNEDTGSESNKTGPFATRIRKNSNGAKRLRRDIKTELKEASAKKRRK
ncbi:hypothetical protein HG535_0D02950 [Zygotorulaspora mrakii]|uniref:Uncharacterized protein n=1 Tax=Zygotorulaspora mrakii TaxID=42260 RepID=A0A7H9B270_ZYGMR|nr:uncharacterized protein HG535_0D02950 [Zygotorulaspora mrakii]QLG72587.1 hypothetical protein HG535_0D02950 [Zygotorulaspora mrakii]